MHRFCFIWISIRHSFDHVVKNWKITNQMRVLQNHQQAKPTKTVIMRESQSIFAKTSVALVLP